MVLSNLHREVLVLIACECAGKMGLKQLRGYYRRYTPQNMIDALGALLEAKLVTTEVATDGDSLTWKLTDKGAAAAGAILRVRLARELMPLKSGYVRLMRWVIERFQGSDCPLKALDLAAAKNDGLSHSDVAGSVVLVNRGLMEFNQNADGVCVTTLGRGALDLTETITGELFYIDRVPYAPTFELMLKQYKTTRDHGRTEA